MRYCGNLYKGRYRNMDSIWREFRFKQCQTMGHMNVDAKIAEVSHKPFPRRTFAGEECTPTEEGSGYI